MKDVILKIFSYNGEFNRKEYLLFGFLAPIILGFLIVGLVNLLQSILGESTSVISIIGFLIIFSIVISSTLKRARATGSNTSLVMVIWVLFTPIAMLYLIFSPSSNNSEGQSSKGSNRFLVLLLIIFVIVVLGVLVAVAIPKLAETKQDVQIAKELSRIQ